MKVTPLALAQQSAPSQPTESATARAVRAFNDPAKAEAVLRDAGIPTQSDKSSGQSGLSESTPEMAESLSTKQASVEDSSAPEAETTTETASDPLSKQYALLAKREKALRAKMSEQESALKAREAELAKREQELTSKDASYQSGYISKDTLKNNTLQALVDAGMDPQDAIQRILEQNQAPVDPRVQAKVDALEAQLRRMEQVEEDRRKQAAEQESENYKQAIKKLNDDAKKLVFTSEEFEMVKGTNSINDVVELIETTWKEEGRLLDVKEAAQMVEDYLVEQAEKLSRFQKIQKRLNPPVAPKVESAEKTPKTSEQPQAQVKTLTNNNSSTRKLSARERALAAFKGEKF